jgi:hypothetical protein
MATDTYTDEGINTRTGCMVVTLSLGAVAGASDLTLPVSILRSEGNLPPSGLYPASWFGLGGWLSVDEFVTKDRDGVFTLHSAMGDVVYDYRVRVPWRGQLDPNDDSKTPLYRAYRTRPFDGTFLWAERDGSYTISMGNPADSRSLTKRYRATLPANPANATARLLSRLEKASIYRGPINHIDIARTYTASDVALTFSSSLYDGTGLTPLEVRGPMPRADGIGGYEITATSTLLHGWSSTVRAVFTESGNVERLVSDGRVTGEQHVTTLTYFDEETPEKTVLRTLVQQEGTDSDRRTLSSFEITDRAPQASTSWPFAVKTWIDRTRPTTPYTHIITECDTTYSTTTQANPRYLTFNSPDGSGVGYEYANDEARQMLVRTKDALGQETELTYNTARGGGPTTANQPATALELKWVEITPEGALPGQQAQFMYRFDKFSIDTYGLPLIGKVSEPFSMGDRQVYYRAVYGQVSDQYNGGRKLRTFDVARGVADVSGMTRWEYRGLDGFTYEAWDENKVMRSYRYVGENPNPDGTFNTENIDFYIMGAAQTRTTRDRFGRVLRVVDFDPTLNPMGVTDPTMALSAHPTTTYQLTPEGFTSRIEDTGSGEVAEVVSWNSSRTTVTSGTVTRGGQMISQFTLPADDAGNQEGTGSITIGPLQFTTEAIRSAGGRLERMSVTGPGGRSLSAELGYGNGEIAPTSERVNGQALWAYSMQPMTATGGCR